MELKKPAKSLGAKIKELLENFDGNHTYLDGRDAYKEAKEMFPNFIKYLRDEYGTISIERIQGPATNNLTWIISAGTKKEGLPIGIIESYIKTKAQTSEFGYKIKILTQRDFSKLKYREGYYALTDSGEDITSNKDTLRYDDEEEIPFP